MKSELLGLILVSVCGFRWCHQVAAALPASTVQVREGEDATLQCPLLDASAPPPPPSILTWYRKSAGQSPQLLLSFRSSGSVMMTHGGGADPGKVTYDSVADPGKVTYGAGVDPGKVTYGAGVDPGKLKYGAGVDPGKVSVASDGSLLLHAAARNDAAIYYCSISQGVEPKNNATPQEVTVN